MQQDKDHLSERGQSTALLCSIRSLFPRSGTSAQGCHASEGSSTSCSECAGDDLAQKGLRMGLPISLGLLLCDMALPR